MKYKLTTILLVFCSLAFAQTKTILINNVEIFNGKDEKTTIGNVLIEGNLIKIISGNPIPTDKSASTTVIDGKENS